MAESTPAGPVEESSRITSLDAPRGVAVLGILLMNVVSYGLSDASYLNISLSNDTPLDWIVGIFGEVFVDQKFMGIFSLLFGAGVVLFADRAAAKGNRANRLSIWRNLLLLGIGALHMWLWDGDILVVYAVCSVLVLALRRLPDRALLALGATLVLLTALILALLQVEVDSGTAQLGTLWFESGETDDELGFWFLFTFFMRALGMMLIGVALYRMGILSGGRSREFYRRMAIVGLGVGLPLAALGVIVSVLDDFSANAALLSMIPNTVGTIPAALGFTALIILWNQRATTALHRRMHALGRMALTNYLSQTILGVLILRVAFDPGDLNRSWLLLFVAGVWAVQLLWSQAWLDRYRFGPFEWVWRVLTYRGMQPLRR
ncbi:MAG: DUF418 domain-containing protein [Chloroflexi bacterium]|nr:DUF418 domain-containing protein [Chloroflexota bacterium]